MVTDVLATARSLWLTTLLKLAVPKANSILVNGTLVHADEQAPNPSTIPSSSLHIHFPKDSVKFRVPKRIKT